MNPYGVILLAREKAEEIRRQDAQTWKKDLFLKTAPKKPKKEVQPIRMVKNWFHALQPTYSS